MIEPLSRFTEGLRSVKTSVDLAAIIRSAKIGAPPIKGKHVV
jgi:hypothetical protein